MNIGYMCGFDDLGCGESEARIRYTYLLEKHGHNVIPLNRSGYTFDSNIYAENLNLDLLITAQVIEQGDIVYPDIFTSFFFWAPSSFFTDTTQLLYYNMFMGKYDCVVGGYESKNPIAVLSQSQYFSDYKELLPTMASVPRDFAIPFEKKEKLKFFYVGMSRRYEQLLKKLDDADMVDIYGPKEVFGTQPWKDFKSYRGTIPFDGKTIIKKMHDAGIVLALHSKSHNKEDYVSNRIFEAAAAGAIIIADDNKFIRRYFGDNVYYINTFKNNIEQDLSNIIQEIFDNKEIAFEKAKRAQQIFLEKLSLDTQVDNFLTFVKQQKLLLTETKHEKIVDCIIRIEKYSEFCSIYDQLKEQYYKNLHLIVCADDDSIFDEIKKYVDIDCTFVKTSDDYFSSDIVSALKGDFFVLFDKDSILHKNHIFKAVHVLTKEMTDFAYSGSYEKNFDGLSVKGYKMVSCLPYNMSSLLSEILSDRVDGSNTRTFLGIYPLSCVVFNRKIITSDFELCNIPFHAVHLVLCVKSLLKDIKNNTFMWTISAGATRNVLKPQTFMYDNHTKEKDEILDKIRSTYIYLISQHKKHH